jgi:hypothetical protein
VFYAVVAFVVVIVAAVGVVAVAIVVVGVRPAVLGVCVVVDLFVVATRRCAVGSSFAEYLWLKIIKKIWLIDFERERERE